jgi:6-phospho-beta-glucosidase
MMKIAIIGAAGVRTPLIVQAMLVRQERLGLSELTLMDIDGDHIELIGALTSPIEQSSNTKFHITRTTDPREALTGADFVITTFRVGGVESRVIDERVPLNHGILGQETTGPGGFAMGIRSIPVLLDYVNLMDVVCPNAWLINFANPAGMLTEAVIRSNGWQRVVGICDAPTSMHLVISALLGAKPEEVYLDYFGLNHLGWIKRIVYQNRDYLPDMLELIKSSNSVPGLPFDPELITNLSLIPNEYLYYYYYNSRAVNNILHASECRGEQIARLNLQLYAELREKYNHRDFEGMQAAYQSYLDVRSRTYMVNETGKIHDLSTLDPNIVASITDQGYAGVALNLIEALIGSKTIVQILNVRNQNAISGMEAYDIVEIPTLVSHDHIQPLVISEVPSHCMGLIKQVKQFEHLTIDAAVERSYQKARLALTIHPLVRDYSIAGSILDEYIDKHLSYFPTLQ